MRILVIGHMGMLGREVYKAVERMGHEAVAQKDFDITRDRELDTAAEVIINCAGLVPQRDPPPTPAEMMRVNGYGPWNLADWCDRVGARLIHVSSDCVFDGRPFKPDGPPHFEGEPPQPGTPYGYSKLAGEIRGNTHLTVRTSFVGFGERGLIAELEQCAEKNEPYRASQYLYSTIHTTRFVAEALVMLAEKEITGLLHIPGETVTRLDLVRSLTGALDIEPQWVMGYQPEIDRRLGSERWEKEKLPDLPSFEWQLEWLSRSR